MRSLTTRLPQPDDHGKLLTAGLIVFSVAGPSAALATEAGHHEGAAAPDQVSAQDPGTDPGFDPGGDSTDLPFDAPRMPPAQAPAGAGDDPVAPSDRGSNGASAPAADAGTQPVTPSATEPATGQATPPPAAPAETAPAATAPTPTPTETTPEAPVAIATPVPTVEPSPPSAPQPAALAPAPGPGVAGSQVADPKMVGPEVLTLEQQADGSTKLRPLHHKQLRETVTPHALRRSLGGQSTSAVPVAAVTATPATPVRAIDHARPGDRLHVVRRGESLWSIATDLLGRGTAPARIAREVQRLWKLNVARIGTGNPDLLMIGTRLRLR
jgi:hypothetical protein